MKRRYLYYILLLSAILLLAASCKKETVIQNTDYVYYINNDEDKIVGESYSLKATDTKGQVMEYIQKLESVPTSNVYKSVLPEGMNLTQDNIRININGQLTIYFPASYYTLSGITEVLCRAAVVKTLCQIDKVRCVEFYVDGNPLVVSNETTVGLMYPEDFLDYTQNGKEYCQEVNLKLYFANTKGKQLVMENSLLEYDGSSSLEELVIKELIKGPDNEELLPTIPTGTTLLKVSEQDGICYVDFNENFLKKREDITDSVALYSVVNSLVEISSINTVQITVNGKYVKRYQDKISLEEPLERNLNIVSKLQ